MSDKLGPDTETRTHNHVLDAIATHSQPFVTTSTLLQCLNHSCDRATLLQCLDDLVKSGQIECQSIHTRLVWYLSDEDVCVSRSGPHDQLP